MCDVMGDGEVETASSTEGSCTRVGAVGAIAFGGKNLHEQSGQSQPGLLWQFDLPVTSVAESQLELQQDWLLEQQLGVAPQSWAELSCVTSSAQQPQQGVAVVGTIIPTVASAAKNVRNRDFRRRRFTVYSTS